MTRKELTDILKHSGKCGLWVLVFLSLLQPFGIDNMKEDRMAFIIAETALAFVSVTISMIFAQTVIRDNGKDKATILFIKRKIVGNSLNIPLLGAMLLSLNAWYSTGDATSYWFDNGRLTLYPLSVMSMYVGIISLFLVAAEYLMFRNDKLHQELDDMKAINALLEQRQERLSEAEETIAADNADGNDDTANEITITGQGIGATLSVQAHHIIYVESMANYADICYISDNEIRHKTLRITLKQIRETLEAEDCIVQCHRAFLVNINFVVALRNNKPGYQLQLFGMDKEIPVSRANTDSIKERLERKN